MKRILVIEDDPAILRGLVATLRANDYEVLSEQDGGKGFALAKNAHPDLLISDIMLPSMNGLQICSSLKQQGYPFPIFLLTSLTDRQARMEGLEQGADDYIPKPFSVQEVLLRVRNALERVDTIRGNSKMLEEEFVKARKIQMNSLPRAQPAVPGLDVYGESVPSTHVGGDYFDFLNLGERRFGIIIADVSGKGMPAAMYVQKMQGIVQSSYANIRTASDLIVTLQIHLGSTMESMFFVTALVAIFDLEHRAVEIARAGHLPALRLRGGNVVVLKPPGPWIGKTVASPFAGKWPTEAFTLEKGDIFLFYTDGVVETSGPAGEMYGLERLESLLDSDTTDARKTVARCYDDVRAFAQSSIQHDDITIIAACFNDNI